MMDIKLFEEITTEQALSAIEEESKTYIGLYVDMENAPERKYVKDKASEIDSILKRLDRSRIDKSKAYKIEVEKQALAIKERLEEANRPFTLLIDEHKAARQKVLDAKRAKQEAADLIIQIAKDHDEALLINKVFAFERAEAIKAQEVRDDAIRREAAARATKEAEQRAELAESARLDNEARELAAIRIREQNKEHQREINRGIVEALASLNIDEDQARIIVMAIAQNKIPNVKINY